MNFTKQDNWSEFLKYKNEMVNWERPKNNNKFIILCAIVGGEKWEIRVNDYPDEPLYTLIINHNDVIHFNEWPQKWHKI